MVVRFGAAIRVAAAIPIAFAGLAGFAANAWSQTVVNNVCELETINNGANLSGNYVLGGDVNASDFTCNGNASFDFTPIGKNGTPFTGTFDGQGHTISNLSSSSTVFYSGLFGDVGPTGIVRNVGVTSATISTGLLSGQGGGVLVGQNEGTVENSYATGSIDGGIYGSNVGGLVGSNLGLITQSYANVAVTGQGVYSYGGLVGDNYASGAIKQSYATGSVYGGNSNGGLVGLNFGAISEFICDRRGQWGWLGWGSHWCTGR